MDLNRYTEKAQEAILSAQRLAERTGHPEVFPEHVLLALLMQADGIVPAVLGKMNVDAPGLGWLAGLRLDGLLPAAKQTHRPGGARDPRGREGSVAACRPMSRGSSADTGSTFC